MTTTEAIQYDRGMWLLETLSLNRLRRQLLVKANGCLLEIGMGTGANLPWYHEGANVFGIDANIERMSGSARRAVKSPFAASCADAQQLPFASDQFDTVVGTLVFCSIPEPERALGEIRRVLRPGGQLLLLEHVRGQGKVSRWLTDFLQPAWFALQGSCHLNRETGEAVRQSGFSITHTSQHGWGVLQLIEALN